MYCGVSGVLLRIWLPARATEGLTATRFFASSDAAAAEIVNEVREGDLILVKGSRSVETDKVVAGVETEVSAGG